MSTLNIDLTGYESGQTYQAYAGRTGRLTGKTVPVTDWYLSDGKEGRRVAKDSDIVNLAPDADEIVIYVPDRVQGIDESFLKLFLGPTARMMGPGALQEKVSITGGAGLNSIYKNMHPALQPEISQAFDCYFQAEQNRIDARARKAKKDTTEVVWSNPQALFIPDIGTKLRLTIPWQFDLYSERRNDTLLEFVTGKEQKYPYSEWGKSKGVLQVKPGAILIVDRVYIRQGSGFEDFSSLSFRMQKGAEIEFNGFEFTTEKNHRFWAKLRQVNTMLAEMDLNSVPGQEKEGTARK